ncbi:3-hydroxyacyl-ACP dehydratase FabZ family protein [Candidatus Laterigemmans baculatus]|uniref:3-hydroxyacyl-ACP dehydratase FabZ family protein n=1 Tax=Candidatus Laterigemmans baculatus TaxID=2770505 RepID=UPI0013DA9C78|nr:3-hydroxyacyl-ACP dehydratase FabZ family protein [Candidatus Laterigemmans baculatus]
MANRNFLVDPSLLDFDRPIAGIEEIRRYNPQRFEMEQLTAILYEDLTENVCAAYKDLTRNEFWVRGHMPRMPLMPGVIMLEAAAQLASYFTQKHDLLGAAMVGFGGVDEVRFRDPVIPGDRLVLMTRLEKARRGRMIVARFQGAVGDSLVVEGVLKGIPIPVDAINAAMAAEADAN